MQGGKRAQLVHFFYEVMFIKYSVPEFIQKRIQFKTFFFLLRLDRQTNKQNKTVA